MAMDGDWDLPPEPASPPDPVERLHARLREKGVIE
jgi:hypothetical protein